MTPTLRICFTHPQREAVARCRGCGRAFCRECVTEHSGRLMCTRCLAAEAKSGPALSPALRNAVVAACLCAGSLTLGGLLLHATTRNLGRVPSSFHDGSGFMKFLEE